MFEPSIIKDVYYDQPTNLALALFLRQHRELPSVLFVADLVAEHVLAWAQAHAAAAGQLVKEQEYRQEDKAYSIETFVVHAGNLVLDVRLHERKPGRTALCSLCILHLPATEAEAQAKSHEVLPFLLEDKKPKILILRGDEEKSLRTRSHEILPIAEPVDLLYGPAFVERYAKLQEALRSPGSGLIILHGPAGTGKTTLVRKLATDMAAELKFLYLPSSIGPMLASPRIVDLLMAQRNAVLVIEDAEPLLMARAGARNDAVVNLLNMTDGLMGDVLSAKFICTFNTELKNIDPSLLRKGRLKFRHAFEKLSVKDATRLLLYRGVSTTPAEPLTLAEAFNHETDEAGSPKPEGIGFGNRA